MELLGPSSVPCAIWGRLRHDTSNNSRTKHTDILLGRGSSLLVFVSWTRPDLSCPPTPARTTFTKKEIATMDEIAKEYDVIVLGTGMSCCSNPAMWG